MYVAIPFLYVSNTEKKSNKARSTGKSGKQREKREASKIDREKKITKREPWGKAINKEKREKQAR